MGRRPLRNILTPCHHASRPRFRLRLDSLEDRTTPAGFLDPTFHGDGIRVNDWSANTRDDEAYGVAVQADDKVIVVGRTLSASNYDLAVARYTAEGNRDSTFGGNGLITADPGGGNDAYTCAAIDSAGRIVVGGYAQIGADFDFVVARYLSNGTPDPSFGGGDGVIYTDLGGNHDLIFDLVIDPAGRIVVAGCERIVIGGNDYNDLALARYTPAGVLDTTFGPLNTGIYLESSTTDSVGRSLALDSAGRIAVAVEAQDNRNFLVRRFTANGQVDASFAGGTVFTDLGSNDYSRAIAVDASDRIVVGGDRFNGSGDDWVLVRYTTAGALDPSFGGGDGIVTSSLSSSARELTDLQIDPVGRIVVAGNRWGGTSGHDFAVARFAPDGAWETTLGIGGSVTADAGGFNDLNPAMALDSAGRVVVAGTVWTQPANDTEDDIGIARFDVNLPPAVAVPLQRVGANSVRRLTPTLSDPDGNSVAVTEVNGQAVAVNDSVTLPSGARVTLEAGNVLKYEPLGALAVGATDSVAFTVADGHGGTTAGTATVLITPRITVADTTPSTAAGALPAGLTALGVEFTEPAASIGAAGHYELRRAGADGRLGTGDDQVFTLTPAVSGRTATFTVPALPEDLYRLTVLPTVTDDTGNHLDGNGDAPGSGMAFVRDFVVTGSGVGLDPTFGGGDGEARLNNGPGTYQEARAAAVQADGKVVIAGMSNSGSVYQFAIARLTADGLPDTSFGGDGFVTTSFGSTSEFAYGVAVQPDGKIVVVGSTLLAPDNGAFAVARYNSDGTLDPTFDGDGKAVIDFYGPNGIFGGEFAKRVVVQPDGKIVVVGTTYHPTNFNYDLALLRLLPDGTPDPAFDGDGKVVAAPNAYDDYGEAVAVQPDGRVVAVGGTYEIDGNSGDVLAVRYTAAGVPDPTFAGDGSAVVAPTPDFDYGRAVVLQPDGKLVIAGETGSDGRLVRLTGAGTIDLGFGIDGVRVANYGGYEAINALDVQADGKLVAVGHSYVSNQRLVVGRYLPDGRPDAAFNGDGLYFAPLSAGTQFNTGSAAVPLPDGRVYAVGSTYDGSAGDFRVLRLTAGPALLTSGGGRVFAVDTAGDGAGQLLGGELLDAANRLTVGGAAYTGPAAPAFVAADEGQTVVLPERMMGDLAVSRRVTVPLAGGNFARTVEAVRNPTPATATATATVRLTTNLGSDGATAVFATSDGDVLVEPTDWWVGTSDGTGGPAVIHVFRSPTGLQPTGIDLTGDSLEWTFDLPVGASQTQRLATLTVVGDTPADARASLNGLMGAGGLGAAAALLSDADLATIANFRYDTAVWTTFADGRLRVVGNDAKNSITLSQSAPGGLLLNGKAIVGNPTISTTTGIVVEANGGNDVVSLKGLSGFIGRATLLGGAGNDALTANPNGADLTGGAGNDTLTGGVGDDRLLETGDANLTLTTTKLTGLGTDKLTRIERAVLTGGGRRQLDQRRGLRRPGDAGRR
jgi:uncharacterized delta-60 repeat protein